MKWLTLIDKIVQALGTPNAQQHLLGQWATAKFSSQIGHRSQLHHWRNHTVDFSGSYRYQLG